MRGCGIPDTPVCTTPIHSIHSITYVPDSGGSRSARWLPFDISKDGASCLYMHSPRMEKEKGVGGGSDTGQTSKGGVVAAVTAAATIMSSSAPIGLSRSILPSPTKSWRRGRREGEEKSDTRSRKVRDLLL